VTNNKFIETPLAVQNYQEIDISGKHVHQRRTTLTLITLDDQGAPQSMACSDPRFAGTAATAGESRSTLGRYPQALIVSQNLSQPAYRGVDGQLVDERVAVDGRRRQRHHHRGRDRSELQRHDVSGTITIRTISLDCSLARITRSDPAQGRRIGMRRPWQHRQVWRREVNDLRQCGRDQQHRLHNILDRMYSDLAPTRQARETPSALAEQRTAVLVAGTVTVSTAEFDWRHILVTCTRPAGHKGSCPTGRSRPGDVKIKFQQLGGHEHGTGNPALTDDAGPCRAPVRDVTQPRY